MEITIDDIIRRLKEGEPLEAISLSLLSSSEQELMKRCASVRSFNKQLVDEVFRSDLKDADEASVPFEQLLSHTVVEQLPRTKNLYRIKEGARQKYLNQWFRGGEGPSHEVPPALREFSDRLVTYYEDLGPSGQLDRLYHLIAVNPNEAAVLFRSLYRKADQEFDRPLCYDLLNILEQRLPILGPKLLKIYNDYLLYYKARGLWVNEYQQAAQYYERRTLRNEFERLIASDQHWMLNVSGPQRHG